MKQSRIGPPGVEGFYQVHYKMCGDMQLEIEGFYFAEVGLTERKRSLQVGDLQTVGNTSLTFACSGPLFSLIL